VVLDLLAVAGAIHVVTVVELAGNAHKKYLTVRDRPRIHAVVCTARQHQLDRCGHQVVRWHLAAS